MRSFWSRCYVIVATLYLLTNSALGDINDDDGEVVKRRQHPVDDSSITDTIRGRILSIDEFGAIPDHRTDISLAYHHRRIRKRNLNPLYASPAPPTSTSDDASSNPHGDNIHIENVILRRHRHDKQKLLDEVAVNNTLAFNQALLRAQPGDVVLIPDGNSYTFTGGVEGRYLDQVTIDMAGTAHFAYNRRIWPFVNNSHFYGYKSAISLIDSTNITITSSSKNRAVVFVDYKNNMVYLDRTAGTGGLINGDGKDWWNDAIAGRLPSKDGDTRPRLVHVISCANVVVEKITLINSPFWTLTVEAVGAEIAHVNVLVDRRYQTNLFTESSLSDVSLDLAEGAETTTVVSSPRQLLDRHSFDFVFPVDDLPDWVFRRLRQPQDLNTDGIDPIGMHIHIHDCIVQNADDSIAVKPSMYGENASVVNNTIPFRCTHNITIENMVLTGFGASVGSVGPTKFHPCVDQVTFRNITMPGTGKGIYIKSDGSDCHFNVSSRITNILYEDIYIRNPFWWSIWIGPQQQHQPNTRIGRKCPLTYPLPGNKHCPTQGCVLFENITLRNVWIEDPIISPGVIMGNETNPMRNVVFDNVTTTVSHWKPYHGRWPFHTRRYPWKPGFQCEHAQGTCVNCHPLPSCFHGSDL